MPSLVETNRWKWSKQVRPLVLARDGRRCQIRLPGCTIDATEVDHIVPRIAGGSDELANLRSACHHCHARRNLEAVAKQPSRLSIGSEVITSDYSKRPGR